MERLLEGFDTVDESPTNIPDKGHTAPELTRAALKHIEEESDSRFPQLHYYDHHEPYETPKRAIGNSEVDHYDGELRYEPILGLLFSEIESR